MSDVAGIGPPPKPGIAGRIRAWWGERPYSQLFVIAVLLLGIFLLGHTIVDSMHRRGMTPGWSYLWDSANFAIPESLISFQAGDPFGQAILAGLLNNLKLAIFGCLLATVLGVSLGIIRLSGNLLLSRLVQSYVELIRNTPLILQLFFWSATARTLPEVRQALQPLPSIYLSKRGIFIPWFEASNVQSLWLLFLALVLLAVIARFVLRRREHPLSFLGVLGLIAIFLIVGAAWIWFAGISFTPDLPILGKFNINGGLTLTPEFGVMLIGLTIYYAASISESVRSGIQSVSIGQWEAGRAIGLPPGRIMRLIILPQAMRVITPLMTSSYLDLTKDTTLGILIGFMEATAIIKTSANNNGNAAESIIVLVIVFLLISLPVSFLINLYNRRLAKRGIIAK